MQTCIKGVVGKFKEKGFEGLLPVDLAVAITYIGFEEQFSRATSISWRNQFEIRALVYHLSLFISLLFLIISILIGETKLIEVWSRMAISIEINRFS
jgi:hypothetical protein